MEVRKLVGEFVKVVADPENDGRYAVVTSFLGNVPGPRLCRSLQPIPDGPTSGLTLAKAREVFKAWETYCEKQSPRKKFRLNRSDGQRDARSKNFVCKKSLAQ